jgi:uncharacterized RDD family membrane protein YckC
VAATPFQLSAAQTLVLMLGWIAVWSLLSRFQSQGQFWHDIWAGTRLVTERQAPVTPKP